MKGDGASPEAVFQEGLRDDLDHIHAVGMIRRVFGLNFVEAKEVMVKALGWAKSLGECQALSALALEKHEQDRTERGQAQ